MPRAGHDHLQEDHGISTRRSCQFPRLPVLIDASSRPRSSPRRPRHLNSKILPATVAFKKSSKLGSGIDRLKLACADLGAKTTCFQAARAFLCLRLRAQCESPSSSAAVMISHLRKLEARSQVLVTFRPRAEPRNRSRSRAQLLPYLALKHLLHLRACPQKCHLGHAFDRQIACLPACVPVSRLQASVCSEEGSQSQSDSDSGEPNSKSPQLQSLQEECQYRGRRPSSSPFSWRRAWKRSFVQTSFQWAEKSRKRPACVRPTGKHPYSHLTSSSSELSTAMARSRVQTPAPAGRSEESS